MSFLTIWCRSGIYTHFAGPVGASDLLHHVLQVTSDPRFDNLRFSILDFRDAVDAVDDAELTAVYAHLIGARYSNDRIRVAAVTIDPRHTERLERFSAALALWEPIRVFADKDAAFEWARATD